MPSSLHIYKVISIKLPFFKTEIKTNEQEQPENTLLKVGLDFQIFKDMLSIITLVWFTHIYRPKLNNRKSREMVWKCL